MDDPTRNHQGRRDDYGDRREGRVVVGVDGSLGSLGALRRAVAEARRLGRQLCTVRVVRPERLGHGLVSLGLVSVDDQEVAALYQQINLAYEEALGGVPGDVKTHSVVMVGTPGQALVSYARYEDDLLVVGAGGQRRWRRRWPGSVSGYCVRHARCPVLTVPLAEFARTMQRARLPRRRTGLEELLDA